MKERRRLQGRIISKKRKDRKEDKHCKEERERRDVMKPNVESDVKIYD